MLATVYKLFSVIGGVVPMSNLLLNLTPKIQQKVMKILKSVELDCLLIVNRISGGEM